MYDQNVPIQRFLDGTAGFDEAQRPITQLPLRTSTGRTCAFW